MNRDIDIDLPKLMKNLYENNEYYVSIKPRPDKYFSGNIRIDPDGKKRNLFDNLEKQGYLSDNKYILDYLNTLTPSKILDLGCGPAWILSELSEQWDKYGLEPDKEICQYLPSFVKIINQHFKNGIFPKDTFDVVLTHHVIEHIEKPLLFIKEIKNILKNEGLLILGTPDFDSACARRFNSNYRLLNDPTHISLFSNDSMHRFLRGNNFKIKSVEYPYFETKYFTKSNLYDLFNLKNISPPFYGNYMTFFCKNIK